MNNKLLSPIALPKMDISVILTPKRYASLRLAFMLCHVLVLFTSGKLNAAELINENFQNWTKVGSWATSGTQAIPAGTVTLNNYVVYNTQVVAGTGSNGGVYIRSGNGVMQLPAISSCGTVEIRTGTNGTGQATMKLQISSNGTDWTDAVALITSPTNGTPTTTQTFVINQSTTTYLKFVAINLNTMIFDLIVTDYVTSGTASPTLTAAASATVDAPFNVSFTDDAAWRTAITSIMVGAATLDPSAYSVSAGTISFTPSASALLQSAGAKSITVKATGYIDALVSQTILAGTATQVLVQTQPTAPIVSSAVLTVQPVVKIADQYGNASTSTANVTASVNGSAAWVLDGTKTKAAVAGIATFTDLTATNEFTGASITFTSGAWSVNSSTFNVPAEAKMLNAGFEDTMGSEWTIVGTTITTTPSEVYAGSKAAHMNANNNLFQLVNLAPNTNYEVSCYAKVAGTDASTYLGVTEMPNKFIINQPISSTEYQKYTINFTTSSATQYKIWGWTSTAGDYYFDNFEINKQFAWTGTGNWSNTANWTPASLPTATASVLVNSGTLTFDENASVASVSVASGATVNVAAGKNLTVNSLTNSGTVELMSDATSGTATILASSATGSGTTKVNQYLGTTRNWYVSSPLTNAIAPADFSYYQRNEVASSWPVVSVGDALVAGTGYIALPSTTGTAIRFTTETGGTINTGDVPVDLTKSESGFNLIGNPYPSHLTWTAAFVDDLTNAALIEPTIWIRTNAKTANSGVDADWSFVTYNAAVSESVPYANVLIAPMQAFWVKAKAAGSLILDDKLIRSHQASNSNPLKAPAVKNADRQRLRLQVDNGSKTDETLIYFDANASDSCDRFDSPKYMDTSESATQLYTTVGTEKLVINGMKSVQLDTPIALGFISGNASSFSIKATEVSNLASDIKLILKDNVTLAETDLTNGTSTYDFTLNNSDANRFSLIFRTAGSATDIANTKQLNFMAYSNVKGKITVKTKELLDASIQVSIYNAVGQKLVTQLITNTITEIEGNFTRGIYVVKVNNSVSKVIVK